ncbi:hypothetical protein OF829_07670 [Sphingomonas sp. LB-2]|uniref:hypothetical protein n=1 Tax=Sphingomonas caeni TaxID=2984949 RepID=UPI0022305C20|nr:hypothetical protein [Sphingomonas caeni]MCW3847114.1 hypothetical protein [Sphingomonas caeni]
MLLLSIMALVAQDGDAVDASMTNYRKLTRADVRCERPSGDEDTIVVCGAREADRYRVPFVSAGRSRDSVPTRTSYLTQDFGKAPCGEAAFLSGCGAVGISTTIGFDGQIMVKRELAH